MTKRTFIFATCLIFAHPAVGQKIKISASGEQTGNEAVKAFDANAGSRWSAEGDGQWIQADLLKPITLKEVDLGFIQGRRRYAFDLQSSSDGKIWKNLGAYKSNGKGDGLEKFTFPETSLRYVRLTSHGNNQNKWMNLHTFKLAGITPEIKIPSPPTGTAPTGLAITEFSPVGMMGSVVGVSLDNQGRVYATHTYRRNNGALDIRRNYGWLKESLASRSVEDKRAMIRKNKKDWESLFKWKEKVLRLADTDGDGVADERVVTYEGLNTEVHGLAGGILWHEGSAFVTCIPGFYRLDDEDGDGIFEKITELVHGFGIHVGYGGHDMHGPTLGPDGRIYWSNGDKGMSVEKDGRHWLYPGQGGVMRIEPDGSNFEVFAHGLRNPQELAFDEFGNLFTVDNDGDFGDKERFHYVVEGSDTGWRSHYQYRGRNYNPWMADGLFKPHFEKQPTYLTPCLSNFSTGPIGFTYNPGTALNEKYRKHFFLAESSKQVQAFQVEPVGAGFKMVHPHRVVKGPFSIGINFGPDGALYLADWGNNAWAPHEKGRMLKLDDPSAVNDPLRLETKKLLGEGMSGRSLDELAKHLSHPDQRVRLAAQFELAKNGKGATLLLKAAQDGKDLLGRIHGIWGLWQRGRKNIDAVEPLVGLLKDPDPEIRAQSAKVLGDVSFLAASDAVADLLMDESPRVRSIAGMALGRLANASHVSLAVQLLAENDGQDVFIRHGGVMALMGAARKNSGLLHPLKDHASKAVRLAAVAALRKLNDAGVAAFLDDFDPQVVSEAARAIHDDLSMPEALPALVRLLERTGFEDEPALRRAINAGLRLGDARSARRLAGFAAQKNSPEKLRVEALKALGHWNKKLELDFVQGFYQGTGPHEVATVHAALDRSLGALLSDPSKSIQSATAKLFSQVKYSKATERITALALDRKNEWEVRASALEALQSLKAPAYYDASAEALKSPVAELRVSALKLLVRTEPDSDRSLKTLEHVLDIGALYDKQQAWQLLAKLNPKHAEPIGKKGLAALQSEKIEKELRLDVLEGIRSIPALADGVAAYEKKLGADGRYGLALEGGRASAGETIFKTSVLGQCLRCHQVEGDGSGIGPDLKGVGKRRDAAYLLRALLNPSADIDPAFQMIEYKMKTGEPIVGTHFKTPPGWTGIQQGDGDRKIVKNDQIAEVLPMKMSIMPPVKDVLSPIAIRDLLAYLKSL